MTDTTEFETFDDLAARASVASIRVGRDGQVLSRPVPHPLAYDNPLGFIVDNMSPTTEADPVGILASLVAAVGTALGPDVRTPVGDASHPLLAWFLLSGATAAGRKGTAGDVAHRVLVEALPEFCAQNIKSGLSSAEGLIAAVADDSEDDQKEESSDKRLLVIESEFAVVLKRGKREGNGLHGVMRQAWDGSNLGVLTKSELVATRPHIGLIGHVTPEEFKSLVSRSDVSGGSFNRLLLLHVSRSQRLPHGGGADPDLVTELGRDLRDRIVEASAARTIRRGHATRSCWEQLYDEFVDWEDDTSIAEWVTRAPAYTLRLAALYAVLGGADEIGAHDLQSAAALVRYSMESVRYVRGVDNVHVDIERIARMIREAGPPGVLRSEITKRYSGRRKARELDGLLHELVELDGYQIEHLPPDGGRPGTLYRYTPTR